MNSCSSCNVKADDISCESREQCYDSYCLKCLYLEYPPQKEWTCANCQGNAIDPSRKIISCCKFFGVISI